jgi:hypothetical protein
MIEARLTRHPVGRERGRLWSLSWRQQRGASFLTTGARQPPAKTFFTLNALGGGYARDFVLKHKGVDTKERVLFNLQVLSLGVINTHSQLIPFSSRRS